MLIKVSLLSVLCMLGLALPALAEEVQESAADYEMFAFTTNEYFNGVEVGSSSGGGASEGAEYSVMRVCAPSEPGGIPNCFMLMLPASTGSDTVWALIKEALHGNILPPLREVTFHGFRIYYYFPYANDVKFTLSRRGTGNATGSVVESITIAQ
jgi:hypothetical protein